MYDWIVRCSGHPDTKACSAIPIRRFPVPPGREVGYGMCKLGVVSQERLKIQFTGKLLLSASKVICAVSNGTTTDDLECLKSTTSASRAVSAVAELLVIQSSGRLLLAICAIHLLCPTPRRRVCLSALVSSVA